MTIATLGEVIGMAGICLWVLGVFVLAWIIGPPQSSRTSPRDELWRSSEKTIDTMQAISQRFRDYVERETRR